MQLGRWRLNSVMAGTYALDGGAMFGVVPRSLWEKHAPPDERNRVRLASRCLLAMDDSGRRVLVDTGPGDRWDAARADRLAIDRSSGDLDQGLASLGLSRADVTDVVLTHLHLDHAGGSARRGASGELECAFPNASWHVQRRHWLWAQAPTEKERASYRNEDFEVLAHCGKLHLVEGPCELFPDMELLVSDSHTVGQQLPRFHAGNTHLTFCGDVIPTRAHIRVPWIMAYDLHPLTTLEEKKMILAEALEEDGILFFEHDLEVAACRLREDDGQPAFREAVVV
ncbi:MAG TPA: MBL fold metallo-hydrolase [Anaeromyxobacteraceae bacterium]|nr:MBL fold metallo-hydrolase [Anaeromyxobacteraceae bacterium]